MPERIWLDADFDDLATIVDVYGEMRGANATRTLDELDQELIAEAKAALAQQESSPQPVLRA